MNNATEDCAIKMPFNVMHIALPHSIAQM